MAGLLQDIRCALRQLRKSRGFTVTAVLMLGLGICANSTALSWIEGTMLNPVPGARRTGELVTVMRGVRTSSPSPPFSYPDYRDLRKENHSFQGLLAYHHDWAALTGESTPQRIYAASTSANYFAVLGVRPWLGRFFQPEEEAQVGGVPRAVLGYSLWQRRFGGDPGIVGRPVEINEQPFTVIGVAPPGFTGCMPGIREDAWVPLAANTGPGNNAAAILQRGYAWLNVMGRLRPGVSRQQATQDLAVLMQRLVAAYPNDHLGVNTISLDPLWRSPFGANVFLAASLPILLAIAAVVLLLTCANVTMLSLVRFVARRRELAIRQALGGGRLKLMRPMVVEGLLLSLGGGALASLLTWWTSSALAGFIPPSADPIVLNGKMDAGVMLGILALAAGASILCGALPAWRASQIQPAEVLKEGSTSISRGASNRRLLSGLVVVQIALSLALLTSAALFLRTLQQTSRADLGFEQARVLTASTWLSEAGYKDAAIPAIERKLLEQARELPQVSAASLTDWLPMSFNRETVNAYPEGYVPQLHESDEVRRASVSPGYFATLGIPLVAGRVFRASDDENAPRVVIVDQTAAAHYWPGQNPLGRRLRMGGRWYTAVGIAKNTVHQQVGEIPEPMVYLSIFQVHIDKTIIQLKTKGDPQTLVRPLKEAIATVNPRLPIFDVRPLTVTTQISTTFGRMETEFASVFALLALALAASGIYGLVAYRTELRTHEIGIRVALGAARDDVARLVVYQGLRLAATGIGLGILFSLGLAHLLQSQLYGVTATDPATFAIVTALLAAIAGFACVVPAARAMRIDPVAAMRAQ